MRKPKEPHIVVHGKRVDWPWGHVYEILEIGPYSIVKFRGNRPGNAKPDWKPSTSYSPFIEGKRIGKSYGSLDAALIGAIVYRHEELNYPNSSAGGNERLTGYIMRLLNPKGDHDE